MEKLTILVIAVTVIAFALVSGRLKRSPLTLPMAFALVGLLVGPQWLGWIEIPRDSPVLHVLAEVTLILVLFTDAARIDLKLLAREHDLPVRLLLIGLPLTIVLGAAIAVPLFTGLSFWECAVLAAILAPTDAALGQAVVSGSMVPVRIRQALNVESGLNDGIALPVVLFLASLAAMMDSGEGAGHWLRFISLQLLLGPLAGIAVGCVGARRPARRSGHTRRRADDSAAEHRAAWRERTLGRCALRRGTGARRRPRRCGRAGASACYRDAAPPPGLGRQVIAASPGEDEQDARPL